MGVSTEIIAQKGYGPLEAGARYYVLFRDKAVHMRVVMARFAAKPKPAFELAYVSLREYEDGLASGLLKFTPREQAKTLPIWLAAYEGLDFSSDLSAVMKDKKKTKAEQVDSRFEVVSEAMHQVTHIFCALDVRRAIRGWFRHEATNASKLHPGRATLWLVTYLAFGMNLWALLPPPGGRGKYSRAGRADVGRKPKHGYGRSTGADAHMKKLCVRGFKKHKKRNRSLRDVYRRSLSDPKIFGCLTETRGDAPEKVFVHPKGEPIPSYHQFHDCVIAEVGHEDMWTALLGTQTYREHYAAPQGSYSEAVHDLLEITYADATHLPARPRGKAGLTLPPVISLPIICGNSGAHVGRSWGFSENSSLYKQALCATAMRKSLVARVLGLAGVITDEDYPISGYIPQIQHTDQGPGAAREARLVQGESGMSHSMSPAHTPQSNSVVEGSHDRSPTSSGPPSHEISKLTALEMAQQEFLADIKRNRSKQVTNRLTPTQMLSGLRSPFAIYKDQLKRGRMAGIQISEEDAIVRFLPKVTFKIEGGLLKRKGVVYRSLEWRSTDFCKNIHKHEGRQLEGRAFDISNLIEWVLVDNRVVLVESVPAVNEQDLQRAMNCIELDEFEKARSKNALSASILRDIETVELLNAVRKHTGAEYMASTVRRGRAKTSAAAKKDLAAMRGE